MTHAWAHPRVSGENVSQLTIGEVAYGSSPRERGKLLPKEVIGFEDRLIPA